METLAVIDFETTGLSPAHGARPTEIAVVLIKNGKIVDRYQSLMNAGVGIPPFIQSLTGISNEMISGAPKVAKVMREAAEFVGASPLVAHNASFDRKFWDSELAQLRKERRQEFICSMMLARRIYPDVQNHKLGTLASILKLPSSGRSHRALADAETAANLLVHMQAELIRRFNLTQIPHEILLNIQNTPRANLVGCINRHVSLCR